MADTNSAPPPAGGNYDVIRKRLLESARELRNRAEALNHRRQALFGGRELALLSTERVRTENNCIPRDVVSLSGHLLFGFQVFIGLKSETRVEDVFSLHRFEKTGDGYDLSSVPFEGPGSFLADAEFRKQFTDVFRYERDPRLLQLVRSDQRLLLVMQIGATLADRKVFRFSIDAQDRVKYVDARGEADHVPPRAHSFEWTLTTREDHVAGPFPHVNILDQVFVETIGGDLTLKVENNTQQGHGIYREPVDDPNQSLDDAEIAYARLGTLILLKVRPFREQLYRYLIFNTRTQHVLRVDTIGKSCVELPENHGILFPNGYYLQSGEHKLFDGENSDSEFERWVVAPNGEDVLYVFYRPEAGEYVLLPYNLIRKEINAPLRCHGYCLFPDGTMLVFREAPSREPSRIHPVQIWQTPFTTAEFAAAAPTDGSYLAKVGNRDLVSALSEVLALCRAVEATPATRANYEDVIRGVQRLQDTHYWLGHEEVLGLLPALKQVGSAADLIVDEYEKQREQERRAREAVETAAQQQRSLLEKTRPTDLTSVDAFLHALSDWKKQRGALITLKELTGIDVTRIGELETEAVASFNAVSQACVEFFLGADAFAPLVARLDELVERAAQVTKAFEVLPLREELDVVHEGLTLLAETIAGLSIQDSTQRTRILEGTSTAFSHQNRARALVEGRYRDLSTSEKRADFAVQFKLLGQSVVTALGLANTPEACDEKLAALLLQLEELEGRFGDLDEFAPAIAEKREEVLDSVATRRQALLEERKRRAGHVLAAAERMLMGIARRAAERASLDELNAYFATDSMVQKVRELGTELANLGEGVHAEEVEAKLKACRQNAQRTLRDRTDLFDPNANLIRFGQYQFQVNTQALELSLIARNGELHAHLTGTDFYEPVSHAALESYRELWDQELVSESARVYRGEFLAVSLLRDAEQRVSGLSMDRLMQAHAEGTLLELVREWAAPRLDEGYERGVHDHDGCLVLQGLIGTWPNIGLLKYSPLARCSAWLHWDGLEPRARSALERAARSAGHVKARFGDERPSRALAHDLIAAMLASLEVYPLAPWKGSLPFAAQYLIEELSQERPRFTSSQAATELNRRFFEELERRGARRDFDEDLRAFSAERAAQLGTISNYMNAALGDAPNPFELALRLEAAARLMLDGKLEFQTSSASTRVELEGLLGAHPRIQARRLGYELPELLERVGCFTIEIAPRYRTYRKLRAESADALRRELRLEEFTPRVLSSFVRNRLIDEVYLPLVGANLAKQLGAAGAGKRTDLMGLLLLVSPPGYGKTTLMEYVANRLGLIFVKINGPALGSAVHSLDPAAAPNATSRQEVERINLALRMGNNVMLYLDDIQHTNPELLQKFISLCDGQRKIEGVWRGQSRTYDLRGKRFCVVMAGNPYTETGARFQIPDMLANRADTYNLGDILAGQAEAFAQSYLENALTSNPTLAPLAGRDPKDLHKLIELARGKEIPASDLSHAYSSSELQDIRQVLRHLFQIQDVLLRVNQEYIASASQDDNYRTEPPFKLQGSYRNMNKLAEKVVSAQTPDEIERLIDDHYQSESQTLTQGAEQNLLKLAEIRGRLTPDQARRWTEIKETFVAVRRMGGKTDDPVARLTGSLLGLDGQLKGIRETLASAVEGAAHQRERPSAGAVVGAAVGDAVARFGAGIEPHLTSISEALGRVARPKLEVQIAGGWEPELVQLARQQLALLEQAVQALGARSSQTGAPHAHAGSNGASSHELNAQLTQIHRTIEQLSNLVAQGGVGVREVEIALAAHSRSNLIRPVTSLDVCGSGGGVFVATYDRPPPLGTPIRAHIQFPGNHQCQVDGRVRYHQDELGEGSPAGYGVEFTRVEPEAAALLETFARLREPWIRDTD
ncbi:MAG TPA: DNA repair ATPase [Polyangiaceae bacterium]|nr:DNA repair ATPase [Polyangiaceae bacterium]